MCRVEGQRARGEGVPRCRPAPGGLARLLSCRKSAPLSPSFSVSLTPTLSFSLCLPPSLFVCLTPSHSHPLSLYPSFPLSPSLSLSLCLTPSWNDDVRGGRDWVQNSECFSCRSGSVCQPVIWPVRLSASFSVSHAASQSRRQPP